MKHGALLFSLAAVAAIVARSMARGEDAPRPAARPLVVTVKVLDRGPSSGPADRARRVLAAPTLVVMPNRPFSLAVGGQMRIPDTSETLDYGTKLNGKIGEPRDGRVRLDLLISTSELVEPSSEGLHLRTESHRVIRTFDLGKTTAIPASTDRSAKDAWVEIVVENAPQTPR